MEKQIDETNANIVNSMETLTKRMDEIRAAQKIFSTFSQ